MAPMSAFEGYAVSRQPARLFGTVSHYGRGRREPTSITVHAYRELAPFRATLCGALVSDAEGTWGDATPTGTPPGPATVDCRRCRRYLAAS
jgi:hypothetical protein